MNSDAKNSDLVQVLTSLKKSEEILFLRNKNVIHFKKKRKFFTFLSLFCLHQTSKNKKVTKILSTIQVKWYYFAGKLYELYLCQY